MATLSLDFSNVKELTNLSIGKHVLRVTKVESETASTGSQMLKVTFVNSQGETGIDYFVLTEAALWKLQGLLKALFKTEFKGVVNLNTDTMLGKTCEATAKEEEYMKQDGTPGIRTVIDNYKPVSEAGQMGIAPGAPVPPQAPQAPVYAAPAQPNYTAPAQPYTPVAPQTPVAPAQPYTPAQTVAPATQPAPVYTQPAAQPQQVVQPQAPAQPAAATDPGRPKRPWE